MDHLTWVMELQDSDEFFALPDARALWQETDGTARPVQTSAKEAVQALSAALRQAQAARHLAVSRAGAENVQTPVQYAAAPGGAPVMMAGSDTVRTEILGQAADMDMEAISRFFEQDARRYG